MGLFFWILVFIYWTLVDEVTFINSVILALISYFALPFLPEVNTFVERLVN